MIETSDLTHRYGDNVAVNAVSIVIPDDEFLLLVGPNGSGKSTLVRHFNGLLSPTEGEVTVDGTLVQDDLVAARSTVGMVFQDPRDQLVASTVEADVAFGPENLGLDQAAIEQRVEAALTAVQLTGHRDHRISELSGGERSRVAIAGALAMEPDHLVLDEPFAGLDHPARESIITHLEQLHEAGTGIIVVTHDPGHVFHLADRVLGLASGTIALDADPSAARDHLLALRALVV